jgi:hypothetical protein
VTTIFDDCVARQGFRVPLPAREAPSPFGNGACCFQIRPPNSIEGRLPRRHSGKTQVKEHYVSNKQQGQGGHDSQHGNNANQSTNAGQHDNKNEKQQSQTGNQNQQSDKHSKLTPSGGSDQQNQSSGGKNEHGSNIKDKSHQGQQDQSGSQGQQGAGPQAGKGGQSASTHGLQHGGGGSKSGR